MDDARDNTIAFISSSGPKSLTPVTDSRPNLRLQKPPPTAHPDRTLNVKNVVITYDSKSSISAAKSLVVFSPERNTGKPLHFEKTSPEEWRYIDIIEVIEKVDFIVRTNESKDFGCIRLPKTELEDFINITGLYTGIRREFANQTGTLKLKLTCEISIDPTGENTAEEGHQKVAYKNSRDILVRNLETLRLLDLEDFYDDPSTGVEPGLFNMCGDQFLDRFRDTRNGTDIEISVLAFDLALQLTPVGDPTFMDFLNDTAVSLLERYEVTRNLSDADKAISRFEITANAIPDGHEYRTARLNYLGDAYESRFNHTEDLYDVSRSISCREQTVPYEDPIELPGILSNLGNSYQLRFKYTGDLADISLAISYKQKAVHLTADDDINMSARQNNLGSSYRFRFERTRELTDIADAISCSQKAVDLTPKGDEYRSARLSNLGIAHISRLVQTGNPDDRSQAILFAQEAVLLARQGNPSLPDRLNNLAISYSGYPGSDRAGKLASISESIKYEEEAIDLIPEDQGAKRATLEFNMGRSYQDRFEYTGEMADLARAMSCYQKTLDLTPEGNVQISGRLNAVGNAFRSRFELTGDIDDMHTTISNYSRAAVSPGPPSIRLDSAKKWAELCVKFEPSQVVDAYSTAISLASQVAGLEQTIQIRQSNLPGMSDLPTSAAAAACQLGKPGLALEWLEQGRCVIWSQLNDLRSPLDDLRESHPTIADEIRSVSTALEYAGSRRETNTTDDLLQKMTQQDEVTTHVKLAQKWDELLAKVRGIHGYEDFLRPPSYLTLLRSIPNTGPVIVINVHKNRCDALALIAGAEKPHHIPLPLFSRSKADYLHNLLKSQLQVSGYRNPELNARGMRYESTGSCVKDVLQQLWSFVVKPILDSLGYSKSPPNLPHIWWCVTGPLAFLPIHAAGVYDGSTTEVPSTLPDFAISSYIPNVRTLIQRSKHQGKVQKKTGLFMIGEPQAQNSSPIPGTIVEVRAIERRLEAHDLRVLRLEGKAATISQAMANMETHSSVHFACHASQNIREPLKSGFSLHDGRLELSSIIQKKLVGVDLAFLSACQTSTGDEKLSEEAVHLAAGMLAAGYRGVVATMWSIQDRYGPQIAEDFYANLMKGSDELSGEGAARALHYATQKIRKVLGDSDSTLLAWVPYVHFGL
ncbi:hypothetical protein GALMADRAFT_109669 [Galerina marginata CBS 339.88]|uniref:CHAT domain-containing protein n=1 Tax=Galerina marginata (strain CBS 339.88) TaxID=685588 RepID=A0A067U1J0_GALM3|nr:hypothetical protein GALMADRAFT_109669 [Galerina marginata CBS 339.88]